MVGLIGRLAGRQRFTGEWRPPGFLFGDVLWSQPAVCAIQGAVARRAQTELLGPGPVYVRQANQDRDLAL